MTVQGETGGSGTKAIATRYPVTVGLTAATTKQEGETMNLVAEEYSNVSEKERLGL